MILACTQLDIQSLAESDLIVRAFEVGATDYMLEPFSATEMVTSVSPVLGSRMKQVLNKPSQPFAPGYLVIDCAERDECRGADRGLSNRIRCGGQE